MLSTSVTSKGQITIPKQIRQKLGISKGSKIEAIIVDEHIELYVQIIPDEVPSTGLSLLKSKCAAVPVDFDPASILNNDLPDSSS